MLFLKNAITTSISTLSITSNVPDTTDIFNFLTGTHSSRNELTINDVPNSIKTQMNMHIIIT